MNFSMLKKSLVVSSWFSDYFVEMAEHPYEINGQKQDFCY
jgi:hypothetical protein